MAQSVSKLFTIDTEHKTFVFNHNNYQELFVDGSEVNRAFKAAMALGCYDGFVPVEHKRIENPDRNTKTQQWSEKGVEEWITAHNPDYLPRWEAMKKARTTDAHKFPFMVRKNLFLFENEPARRFCHTREDEEHPYKLKKNAETLLMAVETIIKRQGKK